VVDSIIYIYSFSRAEQDEDANRTIYTCVTKEREIETILCYDTDN